MVKLTVSKFVDLPDITLDLTEQLKRSTEIIGANIRDNIKRGQNITETGSHKLNSPKYRAWKLRELGEGRPLVAEEKKLIDKKSYAVKKMKMNHVRLSLSNAKHPGSSASIAEIGSYNNFGTNRIPKREFWGISARAIKQVIGYITDEIAKKVDGKK